MGSAGRPSPNLNDTTFDKAIGTAKLLPVLQSISVGWGCTQLLDSEVSIRKLLNPRSKGVAIMTRYLSLRVVRWVTGICIVLFVTYAMMFYGAGDPVRRMYMSSSDSQMWVDERMLEALRKKYGLDKPFPEQFKNYVSGLLVGDWGRTLSQERRPVWDIVRARLPISMQLGLAATVLITVVGIPLGVLASLHHNRPLDSAIVGFVAFANAVPQFVSAPMLMLLLVLVLHVMDVPYGWNGLFDKQVILPVVVMALGSVQGVIRQTRAGMLEVMGSDYIRTARAKGLTERLVVFRHMLRPVLIPVVTSIGLTMIAMVNGAIYVETIFNIPGLGHLTVYGLRFADYPVIMAVVLIGTVIVMVSNLLVDLVYPLLDPRITRD
jgi:peptide/nickel transport system permease protein